MMLRGYTKERVSKTETCMICGLPIHDSFACFTRLIDNKRMCYHCYISECRKSRGDRTKCHCRGCSYTGQELCDKAKLRLENRKLLERIKKLENEVRSLKRKLRSASHG